MIPLEQQVTSLRLSQLLADLGEKQDSLFYWWHSEVEGWVVLYNPATIYRNEGYSAFTVAELGDKLKEWCKDANFCPLPLFDKQTKKWNNFYADDNFIAETEADSRAKMLIWLIENKLVEVK